MPSLSDVWYRKTSTFSVTMLTVMIGAERATRLSFRGNMREGLRRAAWSKASNRGEGLAAAGVVHWAGRSGSPPTGREMKMQVIHHLPAFRPAIAGQLVPALGIPGALCQLPRDKDAAAHQLGVPGLEPSQRLDVALRDDEQMHRCLRVDVLEGEHGVVLVLDVGGRLPRCDSTEHTAVSHESPRACIMRQTRTARGI